MSKNKSLMPLAAITTVLFLAVITRPSPDATSSDGVEAPMLPELKANAEAIDGITIRQGGVSISLQRDAGQWYCASAADYPVERDRIRQLLVQLDQLERWEAKTQDPDRHAAVDLDITVEDGRAIEIELFAGSDLVSHVVLGKRQWSPKSTFARLATEDQTFKCKGHVEVELKSLGWLETTFCTLDGTDIEQVAFEGVQLVRNTAAAESNGEQWRIEAGDLNVPEDVSNLARTTLPSWPQRLAFVDVRPRGGHFESSDVVFLEFRSIEGTLRFAIEFGDEDEDAWCSLEFTPADGQNPRPNWALWKTWSYKISSQRLSSLRSLRDKLNAVKKGDS